MSSIPVAEIFGPTLQGEGRLAGVSTYFLRTGGCDFACAWCDSKQAVLAEEVRGLPRIPVEQLADQLVLLRQRRPGANWLTLSGGNPALYDLSAIVRAWHDQDEGEFQTCKVNIETQGTRWSDWMRQLDLITVSPKGPSSGMKMGNDFAHFMVEACSLGVPPRVVLKVVVFDEADYLFAQAVHHRYQLVPFYLSCGTASGGLSGRWVPSNFHSKDVREQTELSWTYESYLDTKDDLLVRYRWLAERAMNDPAMADVAILPQLHALIWGITARGV